MTQHTQISKNMTRSLWSAALAVSVFLATCLPAAAAEHTLAGIAIFSKARTVLTKYGNPSSILVGRDFTLSPGAAVQSGGQPGTPSQAPGALPGFGAVVPGGATANIVPPSVQPTGTASTPAATPGMGEVTWVYDRPNGVNYEFTLSPDGRVVQIRVTGYKSAVRTGKGISLGQNYGQVLQKYGFPEQQVTVPATPLVTTGLGGASTTATPTPTFTPNVLTIFYVERGHVAFQLINQRVVGIIVGAVG